MLLNDARRKARFENGELVLLADQDRSRWDAAKIARGREVLARAFALQGRGVVRLPGGDRVAAHGRPLDWPQIAALYGELVRLTGSPVVELNRAIAVAEAAGTEAGLTLVDRLDLDGYQYFHSTRADLLRRLGRADEARTEYDAPSSSRTPSPSAAFSCGASLKSPRSETGRVTVPVGRFRSSSWRQAPNGRSRPMSTDLWVALGTSIATLVLLVIPVVVYAYDVLDSWIGDPASYDRVIAAVESGKRG